MTVLFTVLGDPAPTRQARRHLSYEAIVAFVDDPDAPALADLEEMEGLAGAPVEAVPVDPNDLVGTLRTMEATRDRYADEDVAFQVNARDNRLTHPAILCCFRHGLTAWFCTLEGSKRLPVVEGVDVVSHLTPRERRVLAGLPDEADREAAVEAAEAPRERVLEALLGLEGKGLVEAEGEVVRVTDAGRYYRDGLADEADEDEAVPAGDPA